MSRPTRLAMIDRAEGVIVTPNRDDTAVLVTLTARELNPTATIVATTGPTRRTNGSYLGPVSPTV